MMGIVEPPESSLDWNLRALGIAEASQDPEARRWLGSLYNNIGWTYFKMEDYPKALRLFELALAFREKQKQAPQIRIARWCIAKAWRMIGRVDDGLKAQQALLAEYEQIGEPDGYVFEELGECLLALGRSEEARPHFARAYELLSQDTWLPHDEPERLSRLKSLGGR